MQLTKKLLRFLHRIFDKDPAPFLALRLSYDGGMTWQVADGVLSTVVAGGSGVNLSVSLASYTIATLATHLAAQTGYTVANVDATELVNLSAVALLDGSGDIGQSNGDRLMGYTNWLYSYVDSVGQELDAARLQIDGALQQMNTNTAAADWLDEHGGYLGVLRKSGETDDAYRVRMIQRILRPIANNVAIAEILKALNGSLPVTVDDYGTLVNNSYGLFDVDFRISLPDLETDGYTGIIGSITSAIDDARDAGTFLRTLRIITQPVYPYYVSGFTVSGETVTVYPG